MARFRKTGRRVPPDRVFPLGDRPRQTYLELRRLADEHAACSTDVPPLSALDLLKESLTSSRVKWTDPEAAEDKLLGRMLARLRQARQREQSAQPQAPEPKPTQD